MSPATAGRFWSLQGDLKPAKAAAKKKAAKKSKSKKGKSAKMTSAASYGGGACGQEFPSMKEATEHALTHTAA